MRHFRWLGLSEGVFCDRCGSRAGEPHFSVCAECFEIPSTTVRRLDLAYATPHHVLCAMCGTETHDRSTKEVCLVCASMHPDTSHSDFGRLESSIFNHCAWCGSLQIVLRDGVSDAFVYYKTGRRAPQAEAFQCPRYPGLFMTDAQARCTHEWIMVQSLPPEMDEPLQHDGASLFLTEEHISLLRSGIRLGSTTHWCWKCGAAHHLARRWGGVQVESQFLNLDVVAPATEL